MKARLLAIALLAALLSAVAHWWWSHPVLIVYLEPSLAEAIDQSDLLYPLKEAGVRRIKVVVTSQPGPLGQLEDNISIALKLSPDRNPKLDAEMLARGLTGPGYTDRRTGIVYHPDVQLFIKKHRRKFQEKELLDWQEIERRFITNTAVHESWHAITQSTSHNPRDKKSIMYLDPGKSPLTYGWERPLFTAGHRKRLQSLFKPTSFPWNRL